MDSVKESLLLGRNARPRGARRASAHSPASAPALTAVFCLVAADSEKDLLGLSDMRHVTLFVACRDYAELMVVAERLRQGGIHVAAFASAGSLRDQLSPVVSTSSVSSIAQAKRC